VEEVLGAEDYVLAGPAKEDSLSGRRLAEGGIEVEGGKW